MMLEEFVLDGSMTVFLRAEPVAVPDGVHSVSVTSKSTR
jgi:hypothetical protein